MNTRQAADAILQTSQEITVGEKTYQVAPPTVATLILASKEMSNMPIISMEKEDMAYEILAKAEYFESIGRIVAILMLGAKTIAETTTILFWKKNVGKRKLNVLSEHLLSNYSPIELRLLFIRLLGGMQIRDFFLFITSLNEINLLKPTRKETQTSATAPGLL